MIDREKEFSTSTTETETPSLPTIGELAALVKELGPPPTPMTLYMDAATYKAHEKELSGLSTVRAIVVADGFIAPGKYVALPDDLFNISYKDILKWTIPT